MQDNENKKDSKDKIITIPNILSAFRILGSIVLLYYIALNGIEKKTFVIISTAILGLTDALDGMIARKFSMESKLGGVIDPIADKVFAYGIGIVLMVREIMPIWPLIIVIRDISVWILTCYRYFKTKQRLKPTGPARVKMVLQSTSILSTLLFGFGSSGLSLLAPTLMILAVLTVIPEIYFIKKYYF